VRSQGTRGVVRIHVSARLDLHDGSLPLTRGHDDGGRTDRSAPRTDDIPTSIGWRSSSGREGGHAASFRGAGERGGALIKR